MNLELITGTAEEYESAIACPAIDPDDFDTIQSHMLFLDHILREKSAEQAESISLRSIKLLEDQADNFSLIGDIFRSIIFFASMSEYPQTVRIVCDSDETARLYEEIYDYWFAEETL